MNQDCKKPFHKHLMIRAQINKTPKETEAVINWLREFVYSLGMKILQGPFSSYVDQPGNKGITATVMIETSHIAFHIWDEEDPALLQFDLYTCGSLDVNKALRDIDEFFSFNSCEYILFDREHKMEMITHEKKAKILWDVIDHE
jgi:S-adenosylmethionine/arginine decarboxylase-like enzyme